MAAAWCIASRPTAKPSSSTARRRKKSPRSPSTAPATSTPPAPGKSAPELADAADGYHASSPPAQNAARRPAAIILARGSQPRRRRSSPFPAPGLGATGGSEIYRIAPDGAPSRLWSSREDLVYALGFDQHGRLLAGTGNRGHIFAINGVDDFTDLVKASATQITAFAAAPGGGLYASSSNLGKIFVLGPGLEVGRHVRKRCLRRPRLFPLGTRQRARHRQCPMSSSMRAAATWTIPTATGAPGRASISPADSELKVPPARFVQWKSVLHAGNPAPRVDNVLLNYLPKNVAPEIDDITVQPGYRYQPIPHVTGTRAARSRTAALRSSAARRSAIAIRSASAGRRMTTTTTSSSTPSTTAATANRAGCC